MAPRPRMITEDGESVTHFDLDALQAEARDELFTFRLGGEAFTMLPPEEADWQISANLSEGTGLTDFMAELLGDDYERFSKHAVPTWKLTRLIDECSAFYGVKPGESRASKNSSRGTRRR